MPEYLAPGVYVEETSFRAKTIEGVSTSTAAFVGPTRFGPLSGEPELVTSFAEFERIYAGLDQLEFTSGTKTHNFAAQAVRSFFEEGGRRLYVARVFKAKSAGDKGIASKDVTASAKTVTFQARYPGVAGNVPMTPSTRLAVETTPSLAPSTAARSQPIRSVRCRSRWRRSTGAGLTDCPSGPGCTR
jgi:phage tail sheath protein FI